MIMKKMIPASIVCLTLLASCNKQESVPQPLERGEKAVLNVSISGGAQSKAIVFDENKVNSLQVFVFNGNMLDVYGSVNSAMNLTLNATVGDRTVYALVNAPDLSSISELDGLKAAISQLSDNAPNSFVMVGSDTPTLAQNSNITIVVNRLAARIRVQKVTRNLSSPGLASLDASSFKLVRIYAADAVVKNNYSLTLAPPYSWKNSTLGGSTIDASDELLLRKPSSLATIAQNASYTEDLCVYVYPNLTEEDSDSAHCTRLVVECLIDRKFYTYPVSIPKIQANRSYDIKELVLTRLGNQSNGDDTIDSGETEVIESFEIPFGIGIQDWTTVLLGDEGTVTI